MSLILEGNPLKACAYLVLPEKELFERDVFALFPSRQRKIWDKPTAHVPDTVARKIHQFLKGAFDEDLSGLQFSKSTSGSTPLILEWGSRHINSAYILLPEETVEKLSQAHQLSKEDKLGIQKAVNRLLENDARIKEAFLSRKETAKRRLIGFGITAVLMSPLIYYSQSTLERISSSFLTYLVGSWISGAVGHFCPKKVTVMNLSQ